jgi:hypothetical protein
VVGLEWYRIGMIKYAKFCKRVIGREIAKLTRNICDAVTFLEER